MMTVFLGCVSDVAAEPQFESQQVYKGTRFTSIVTTLDGTVLAFFGKEMPMTVCRSEDGGKTWGEPIQVSDSDTFLGAAVVDNASSDVMMFDTNNEMYRSSDDGKTWRKEDIEVKADLWGNVGFTHGADSGITLEFGEHKGRLILPARVNPISDWSTSPYGYNTTIMSDDGGRTWQTGHPFPVLGSGEGTLAELSDGSLIYNSRCHVATDALRRQAWSYDGGMTWINPITTNLPDGTRRSSYGCAGGLVRLDIPGSDVLIFSNLDSDGGPKRGEDRANITVWASFDGGKTWPIYRRVYDGPSAYSSLTVGRAGTPSEGYIYLEYEGGPEGQYEGTNVARFNLEWVKEGQTWPPPDSQ